ncbi:hypothetical protein BH24ACT3_BH24ACT3_02680 [soil metagenome]
MRFQNGGGTLRSALPPAGRGSVIIAIYRHHY